MDLSIVILGALLSGCGVFIGFIRSEVKELQHDLTSLSIKVAAEYVHKNDLDRIYETLKRIEDKLDSKADK